MSAGLAAVLLDPLWITIRLAPNCSNLSVSKIISSSLILKPNLWLICPEEAPRHVLLSFPASIMVVTINSGIYSATGVTTGFCCLPGGSGGMLTPTVK